MLLPVLGRRYIYFRYNATSGDIVDNIEQLDLENMGFGILFVGVLELEITLGVI